ncbi:MAG: sensor histidine kinase, partial [Fimbriimonadales bacterium]
DLWVNFAFRVAMVWVTAWLIFQVLRSHLEYRNELAELRERLELGQERERIAREFHDGLGNTLVNAIRGLELLSVRFRNQVAEATETQIADLACLIRTALDETRQMIRQLNPLGSQDLCHQIAQMAQRTADRLGAQLHLECPCASPQLSPIQSLMITQVVKEALTNALKHAGQPRNLWVQFQATEECLEGCIRDDGDGFDPQRILEGYGMHHMEERIKSLGGSLVLESAPNQGTTVRFRIPLENQDGESAFGHSGR